MVTERTMGESLGAGCLNPAVLRTVVEAEIQRYIQPDAWEQSCMVEQAETDSLSHILDSVDKTG